jgi:hypothetical protein
MRLLGKWTRTAESRRTLAYPGVIRFGSGQAIKKWPSIPQLKQTGGGFTLRRWGAGGCWPLFWDCPPWAQFADIFNSKMICFHQVMRSSGRGRVFEKTWGGSSDSTAKESLASGYGKAFRLRRKQMLKCNKSKCWLRDRSSFNATMCIGLQNSKEASDSMRWFSSLKEEIAGSIWWRRRSTNWRNDERSKVSQSLG